jgi:isopenicillin N synthase-like dioxygenase
MTETKTFDTLPILPLSHARDPATKPKFLEDLRHALLNVGFLYLSETGLPDQLIKDVIQECQGFFKELPQEEKERIEMKNQKSFLGWSRVSLVFSYATRTQDDEDGMRLWVEDAYIIGLSLCSKEMQSIAMLEKGKTLGNASMLEKKCVKDHQKKTTPSPNAEMQMGISQCTKANMLPAPAITTPSFP